MEEILSLDWMAQGNLQARFDRALQTVLENVADMGYEAKAKRQIIITFKLKVSENRMNAELSAEVATKLPTEGPAIAALMIGRSNGKICATERVTPLLPLEKPSGPELIQVESNLKEFGEGTLYARFEDAFEELLENATDPNTPTKSIRKIVATVTIKPNAQRTHADLSIDMATTKAKPHKLETTLLIGNPADAGPVKTSQLDLTAEQHPDLQPAEATSTL